MDAKIIVICHFTTPPPPPVLSVFRMELIMRSDFLSFIYPMFKVLKYAFIIDDDDDDDVS